MKVILLDNIKKLGARHDMVEVKNGYAYNFLIPQKKAIMATTEAEAQIHDLRRAYVAELMARKNDIGNVFGNLANAKITLTEKANKKGGLYQGIDKHILAEAVELQLGLHLDTNFIILDEAIKELGTYTVPLVFDDLKGSFEVEIVGE